MPLPPLQDLHRRNVPLFLGPSEWTPGGGAGLASPNNHLVISLPDAGSPVMDSNAMPLAAWDGLSAVQLDVWWAPSTNAGGGVRVAAQYRLASPGVALPTGTASSQAQTLTAPAVAFEVVRSTFVLSLSTVGVNHLMSLRVFRDSANAADTFTGVMHVVGVSMYILP